jgi:hypothetical protein
MKPYMLRRWKRAASPDRIPFFTCARPGRTSDEASKKAMVADQTVEKWITAVATAPKSPSSNFLSQENRL